MRLICSLLTLFGIIAALSGLAAGAPDARQALLRGGYRTERDGWVFIHAQGPPRQLGFQNGYLVAPEFDDFSKVLQLYLPKTTSEPWSWYREAARTVFWPKLEPEYKQEILGIAEGLQARGYTYDYIDVTLQNAWVEISDYYLPWLQSQLPPEQRLPRSRAPEACSAIVATGSQTADGKIVMCHTAWVDYLPGQRLNIIADFKPSRGNRILMDSMPGLIHSLSDFYVTSAGLAITETTIAEFFGFDPEGIPEFQRARKAVQYSNDVDSFVKIISVGDNGGYANTWLIGDTNSNEIAKLELGLKNKTLYRSHTGAYPSENFIDDPKLIREETTPPSLWSYSNTSSNRRERWHELMARDIGRMDESLAQGYMADHWDVSQDKIFPGGRTLDGHMELDPRPEIMGASAPRPFGANQAKVTTADLIRTGCFWGRMGHACGLTVDLASWLKQHPVQAPLYAWQLPLFKNVESHPWTLWQPLRR